MVTGFAGDRSSILRQEVLFLLFLFLLFLFGPLKRTYEFCFTRDRRQWKSLLRPLKAHDMRFLLTFNMIDWSEKVKSLTVVPGLAQGEHDTCT